MRTTNITLNRLIVRGSDMIKRLLQLPKRLAWKVLGELSRPIKASEWYRGLFIDYGNELYPSQAWFRKHDERNFDVVAIGSASAKYAYDWSAIDVKGMNWGQVPQTLVNSFKLVKNFFSIVRKRGNFLITLCPFSGLHSEPTALETLKYLRLLDHELTCDMPHLARAQRLAAYPILFGKPAIKAGLNHLLKRERKVEDVRPTLDHNPMSEDELRRDAENWMRGWARQFGIADFEAPLTAENLESRKVRVKVLRDLVDFCVERGYRPVYVIPPVERHLAEKFTKQFKEIYIYGYLKDVARDVPLLDYTNDPEWQSADLYFNSFFLNRRGRKLFTECVVKDVGL